MAKMTKAQKKVGKVMREFKGGKLHSGKKGPVVKSRKQAIAIALSEAGMSKPRKFADGGMVNVAAPPVGMTDLSGAARVAAPAPQLQAQQQGPYSSPMDYGTGSDSSGTMSYQANNQNVMVRNRMGGGVNTLGNQQVQGFAKGGLVTARGMGKVRKTKPCKIC